MIIEGMKMESATRAVTGATGTSSLIVGTNSKLIANSKSMAKQKSFNINDYVNDLPLLVSDLTDDEDELGSIQTSQASRFDSINSGDVNSWIDDFDDFNAPEGVMKSELDTVVTTPTNYSTSDCSASVNGAKKIKKRRKRSKLSKVTDLSPKIFKQERNSLMMVIIKYVSIKITNLFPPSTKETKISLEKWLVIIINRLKLSLNSFLKSMIYLFRYMDIIYLLRYLNQSNNFANFNEMDYPLKKLVIGCVKLTLMKEKVHKNWAHLVGLPNNDINLIIKTILKRLNNKLIIKDDEIAKFKTEIFRYVKMVSSERT